MLRSRAALQAGQATAVVRPSCPLPPVLSAKTDRTCLQKGREGHRFCLASHANPPPPPWRVSRFIVRPFASRHGPGKAQLAHRSHTNSFMPCLPNGLLPVCVSACSQRCRCLPVFVGFRPPVTNRTLYEHLTGIYRTHLQPFPHDHFVPAITPDNSSAWPVWSAPVTLLRRRLLAEPRPSVPTAVSALSALGSHCSFCAVCQPLALSQVEPAPQSVHVPGATTRCLVSYVVVKAYRAIDHASIGLLKCELQHAVLYE